MIYESETGLKKVIGTRRPRASRNPLTLTSSSEIKPAITVLPPAPLVSQPGDFVTEEKLARSLEELKSYMERSIKAGIKANSKKFDDLRDIILERIEVSAVRPTVDRPAGTYSNEQPAKVTSTDKVVSSTPGDGTTGVPDGFNSPGDNDSDDSSSDSSSNDLQTDAARAASEAAKKLKKQMQQVEETRRSSMLSIVADSFKHLAEEGTTNLSKTVCDLGSWSLI